MVCLLAPVVSDEAPLVYVSHVSLTCAEAVVNSDYDAQQDNELTLRVGQALRNVHVMGEGWAGELFGEVGMFPTNFVEMRKVLSKESHPLPPVAREGQ